MDFGRARSALVETFYSRTFMTCMEGADRDNRHKNRVTTTQRYKLQKGNVNFEFTQIAKYESGYIKIIIKPTLQLQLTYLS